MGERKWRPLGCACCRRSLSFLPGDLAREESDALDGPEAAAESLAPDDEFGSLVWPIYRGLGRLQSPVVAQARQAFFLLRYALRWPLAHLRSGGRHARGCWALDVVLGRT